MHLKFTLIPDNIERNNQVAADCVYFHSCNVVLGASHNPSSTVEPRTLLEGHRDVVCLRDVLDGWRAGVRVQLYYDGQLEH